MDSILSFFIRQKKLALVFTLSIILVGLIVAFSIQRDEFPNVEFERMDISAIHPGNSPEDIEINITNPIEDELKNVSGIKSYESTSKEGSTYIVVNLEPDLDNISKVKQEVKDAVNRVKDLPSDLENLPYTYDINPEFSTILQVNLVDKNANYEQMRVVVNRLEKELTAVAGVSRVDKDGYLKPEIYVYLNQEKLLQYKISIKQVVDAISAKNRRYTAGHSDSNRDERNYVVLSKFQNPTQVADVIVTSSFDGPEIKLSDIARIVIGNEDEQNIIRVNGKKGFILRVQKQENADIIKTVEAVKVEMKKQQKNLSKSLEVFYTDDESYYVKNRLNIVSNNGLIGLVFVLFVLSIFLSARSAFWVAVSLPVVIFGMVIFLKIFGETINLVSLAAVILVLGLVVDDSIIIAESIHHYRQKIADRYEASLIGLKRVINPILVTMITTILAFSSMFLMSGTMGKFIYIMPLVVIFALLISFFEIIIALPAHLAGTSAGGQRLWFVSVENIFKKISVIFLRFRYLIFVLFWLIFALSVWLGLQMKFTLFPEIGIERINTKLELSPGSSLLRTEEEVTRLEQIIFAVVDDELYSLSSEIGKRFDHIAYLKIHLKPAATRKRTGREIYDELKVATKEKMANVGKIEFFIRKPGPDVGSDIEINLVSANNIQRQVAADKLAQILQNIEGFSSLDRDDELGKKRIEVVLDYSKIARLDLELNAVQQYLKASLDGIVASTHRQGRDDIDFSIRLDNQKDVASLKIPNKKGLLIPIMQFASLKKIAGEANYNHYNGERSVRLSGGVDDKKASPNAVIDQALSELDLANNYPDVRAVISGGADETQQSVIDFGSAFALSIIGIYLLLMLLFNSYTQPLMVVSTIPLSIVGIVIAFFLHGQPISFFTILGALALVGVIVNDGLILVSHLNFLAKNQDKNPKKQTTKERISWIAVGAKDRLRAVVLTTLTTLAGVIPLAYGIGGTDFILQPMALALGYGLVFGTAMTLILMPALYLINLEIVAFFSRVFFRENA